MANQRLSSRYVSSIFQLASDSNSLKEVFNDILLIKQSISDSKELELMMKSPIINSDLKKSILSKIFGDKISELTNNFLELLISKGRENNLLEMCDVFITEYNDLNKIADVTLITAIPATENIVKEVTELLTNSGKYKDVTIKQEVDSSIIGGFILKMDDQLLDNSIQRKLQVIRKELV